LPSRKLPQCPAIILHHLLDGPFDFLFRGPFANWHQHDCTTVVYDRDVELIAHLHSRQIHQSRAKNDSLRIPDFGNGFGHTVILCFTWIRGKRKPGAIKSADGRARTGTGRLGRTILSPLLYFVRLFLTNGAAVGFTMYVPEVFRVALRSHSFQVGDTIYDTRAGIDPWADALKSLNVCLTVTEAASAMEGKLTFTILRQNRDRTAVVPTETRTVSQQANTESELNLSAIAIFQFPQAKCCKQQLVSLADGRPLPGGRD
jgi:hypothetical protein